MANAHSFPILRLPCLAKEHVIMVMNFREQYLFSKLSKKSKILTRNGARLLSCVFAFHLYERHSCTFIKKEEWDLRYNIFITKECENNIPYIGTYQVNMAVKDIRQSSLELLGFLADVFKSSSFELIITKTPNDAIKEFLTGVNSLKITTHTLEVYGDGQDNATFECAMNNCRDVKKLKNYCETTPDFEFNTQQPFTFESCHLLSSPFLTLNHLTGLFWNCRAFQTDDKNHKLTNDDFNHLINLWMEGGSKLEYVDIELNESFNLHEVMTDIEKVPVVEACLRNKPTDFKPNSAFKVQQHSQKEALVCLWDGRLIITTHFNEKDCDLWAEYNRSDEESEGSWSGDEETSDEEEEVYMEPANCVIM